MAIVRVPLGSLLRVGQTAETETHVFRPRRRPVRGAVQLLLAVALFLGALTLGVRLGTFLGWLLAALPLVASAVLAARGLTDVVARVMFQLEIDHRARTLTLSALLDQGQAVTQVRFDQVKGVDLTEKEGAWMVSLPLADGRRVALGCYADRAEADAQADRFRRILAGPPGA